MRIVFDNDVRFDFDIQSPNEAAKIKLATKLIDLNTYNIENA
jgi:hypothetical protein